MQTKVSFDVGIYCSTMKKSPVYPKYEAGGRGGDAFDPYVNFSQFLEEARHHARGEDFQGSSLQPEGNGKERLPEDKKGKKSWKNSLLSWWKTDKKSKPPVEPSSSSYNSTPRGRLVSGSICASGKTNDGRNRRPTSGPIAGLFNSMKTMETEVPYMCLEQFDRPHSVQTYGPVYLVT